jgi:methylated-DNA-[protein]-cysteine S-methyltransferase
MNTMDKLIEALRRIPKGEVRSYKDIALEIETGPRVVAKLISKNPFPIKVPCHRVIKNNGEVGGYTYKGKMNVTKKIALLRSEGVEIVNGKVIGF